MTYLSTDLSANFLTLMLGMGQLALVFMGLWIPLYTFLKIASFRNIL